MTPKSSKLLLVGGLCASVLAAGSGPPGRITFAVHHLRSDDGLVRCFLFSGPEGYPGGVEKSIRRATSKVSQSMAQCTFEGLPAGEYAISCYHDENSNDHFDTNFLGIPKEGHAASNDSNGAFGPTYKGARFSFDGGDRLLRARFFY